MKLNGILIVITFLFIISFSSSAQTPQIKVACIGNSITQGFGTNDPRSYPQQLGLLLGNHYLVKNFGVGGRTLLRKGDFPYWKETSFLDAQDFDPDILIISLGTNDSKPQNWIYKNEFYSDYMDFIHEFRKNNRNPQIFVCFPTPVVKDNFGISDSIIHYGIIPIIDSVRKTAGTCLINDYESFPRADTLFSDGVHPTETGYKMMAQIAFNAIEKSPSGITRYFYSDKTQFEKGDRVKFYWETTPGSQVTINGLKVNETDSMLVDPGAETLYTLISKGETSDTSTVRLSYLAPGKIKFFNAYPPFIDKDYPDTSTISWSATKGSQVTLENAAVEKDGFMFVSPKETRKYTLIAKGDLIDSAHVEVQVLTSDKINRAYLHSVSSSLSARGYDAKSSVDGDINTYWLSGTGNSHWVKIDLLKEYIINRVVIHWGNTYARGYNLQTLNDAGQTGLLFSTTAGDGQIDDISGLSTAAHYLRLLCVTKSNADSGYAVKEIEVFGKPQMASDVTESSAGPVKFSLEQNYPNPFNPATRIDFELAVETFVSLKIFDITGREIAVLENSELKKGKYSRIFNAQNLSSGIYFYRIQAGGFSESKAMILLK